MFAPDALSGDVHDIENTFWAAAAPDSVKAITAV
jgi:hypothetical protein